MISVLHVFPTGSRGGESRNRATHSLQFGGHLAGMFAMGRASPRLIAGRVRNREKSFVTRS